MKIEVHPTVGNVLYYVTIRDKDDNILLDGHYKKFYKEGETIFLYPSKKLVKLIKKEIEKP